MPDIAGHAVQAIIVGFAGPGRLQIFLPLIKGPVVFSVIVGSARWIVIAPGIFFIRQSAARGVFELDGSGQPIQAAVGLRQPLQIRLDIVTVDKNHRILFFAGRNSTVDPMQWRRKTAGVDKTLVLGVGDRMVEHFKIVDADQRPFVFSEDVSPFKAAAWNSDKTLQRGLRLRGRTQTEKQEEGFCFHDNSSIKTMTVE
ncbi:MAG: hypothetical protein BWY83_01760 [bacterium ADurb.Bin478]|nr:MAG: hypothetical protein BWY83_01760 [bacterium ADurb.Bin478]